MSWFSFAPEELEDEGRKKLIIECKLTNSRNLHSLY